MGIFKYLWKVYKNKENVYENENQALRDAGSYFITFLVFVGILAFPISRVLLKWIAYFSMGSCAIFMLCLFISNMKKIGKSFRYAKRLEKIGTSVEEEEKARRALCELEGDDGLPSRNNNS